MDDARAINLIRITIAVVALAWLIFKLNILGPALIFLIVVILVF